MVAFSVASRTRDTKVAVDGRCTVAIPSPPSHQHDGASHRDVTLTNYMRLPVEQYVLIPMPLGSSLNRLEINDDDDDEDVENKTTTTTTTAKSEITPSDCFCTEFELLIPEITFLRLTLRPVVYATVTPQSNRVVISSKKCILRGSPFIEKVKLNDRFDFSVTTTLTWEDRDAAHSPLNESEGSITAETTIRVNVDVPRPFKSIPKRVLEATGNAAVKFTLQYVQGNFVDNLAKDYVKWATVTDYRSYRASLSMDKAVGDLSDSTIRIE